MVPIRVQLHAQLLQTKTARVGLTPRGHNHSIEGQDGFLAISLVDRPAVLPPFLEAHQFHFRQDLDSILFESILHETDNVGILSGQDGGLRLHERDPRSQAAESLGQFAADGPPSHHQQAFGLFSDFPQIIGV